MASPPTTYVPTMKATTLTMPTRLATANARLARFGMCAQGCNSWTAGSRACAVATNSDALFDHSANRARAQRLVGPGALRGPWPENDAKYHAVRIDHSVRNRRADLFFESHHELDHVQRIGTTWQSRELPNDFPDW